MAKINLTGKSTQTYERVKLVHEERMTAVLSDIRDVVEQEQENKDKKTGKMVKKTVFKIPMEFKVTILDDIAPPKIVSLTFWASTTVSKGSGTFDSSKLYIFLEKAKLLEKFTQFAENKEDIPDTEIVNFLRSNATGLTFEIEIVNSNRGKENEYSSVGKVVKLLEGKPQDSIGKAAQTVAVFGSGVSTANR